MPRKIDLTNKKFGRWQVIQESPERKNGRVYWLCECECGTRRNVSGSDLRNGNSTSCGCYRDEKNSINNSLDLLGKRFNRLLVIEKTKKRLEGMIIWKCQCDCGNFKEVPTSYLTSGDTQSCGCYQKEQTSKASMIDISNQRFGRLIAIEPTQERSGKTIKWKCRCDCGNFVNVASTSLRQGLTKSCGCLKSLGEEKISCLLQQYNIHYEIQKSFDTCRFPNTNALAKFDFYIENNYLLEFDGEQHFKSNNRGWNTFEAVEKLKQRDEYKNQWCKEHNIPLIRIPYTHLENLKIQDLLCNSSNPFMLI